jgi:hypothetical protein
MATKEEVAEVFDAQGASGAIYEVRKVQKYVSNPSLRSGGWAPGSVRYELASGEHVNPMSNGQFEIMWLDRADNELISRIE